MNIDKKAINYAKVVAAETIANASSGHTGVALGSASIFYALFKDHYNFDISDPEFINRDRFVCSAGHASAIYYTMLSMFGFNVSLADLKEFRKLHSKTPGHPEFGVTDGVEASTGPLGQGVANAVGMAISESILAERFNAVGFPIIDNYTYCFVGDGCLMEGVAQEAISLAGTLALKKLILLYDSNDVTIDGNVGLANNENVAKKFKAMHWNVIHVRKALPYFISRAIKRAKKSSKPSIIIIKTTIGEGTDKAGTSAVHGIALSQEELAALKARLKVNESFYIPGDVRDVCMNSARRGKLNHETWNGNLAVYQNTHPDLYKQFMAFFDYGKLDYDKILKGCAKWEGLTGREINSIILNEIADRLPCLIGGTADLAPSTKAYINGGGNYSSGNRRGRNIHYGIREHAMGAISNGIALYENFSVFDATFLTFSNYMLPPIRMAALMKIPVIHMFTHDTVSVGEDGPTHQPIEQLATLRAIINNTVFRPADGRENIAAYKYALSAGGPTCLILTKQKLPLLECSSVSGAEMGGYVIKQAAAKPDVVIYASGSEVALALEVSAELSKKASVNVVSLPSLEIFEKQSAAYKSKTLFEDAKLKVAIELSNDKIWYKYVGDNGIVFSVKNYQGSGKGEKILAEIGFTVKSITKEILAKLK